MLALNKLTKFKVSKRTILVVAGVLALFIAGLRQPKNKAIKGMPQTLRLEIAVKMGTVEKAVELSGRITPKRKAEIKSLQGGIVTKLHVLEGQNVTKGGLLAEIQQEPMYAWQSASVEGRVISAKAVYLDAEDRLRRYETLFARGVISADKVSEAKREAGKAAAALKEANLQASVSSASTGHGSTLHTRLTSPMDGKVVKIRYHEGEIVISGSNFAVSAEASSATVLEVADMSDMIVRLQIPETDITYVHPGQGARVLVSATNAVYPASVYAASPSGEVDPKTSTVRYEVLVDVYGEDAKLLPGMTVAVKIPVASKHEVLYLPPEYVYEDDRGNYVLSGDDMHKVRVQAGLRTEDAIEIVSGLKVGDKVTRIRVLDPNEFDVVKL